LFFFQVISQPNLKHLINYKIVVLRCVVATVTNLDIFNNKIGRAARQKHKHFALSYGLGSLVRI